jgi:hypothetical protein
VVAEFARILKPYRVVKVIGDKYAGEWPREVFRSHGVTYEANGNVLTVTDPATNVSRFYRLATP